MCGLSLRRERSPSSRVPPKNRTMKATNAHWPRVAARNQATAPPDSRRRAGGRAAEVLMAREPLKSRAPSRSCGCRISPFCESASRIGDRNPLFKRGLGRDRWPLARPRRGSSLRLQVAGGRKMHGWEAMAGAVAVAVAVASLLVQLRRGTRRDADAIFAVVSGSLAMSLMAPWLGAAPAWMQWAVLVGASATCNGYWLLARALFRGEGGVGRVQVAVAAGVAALVVAYRGAMPWAGGAPSP